MVMQPEALKGRFMWQIAAPTGSLPVCWREWWFLLKSARQWRLCETRIVPGSSSFPLSRSSRRREDPAAEGIKTSPRTGGNPYQSIAQGCTCDGGENGKSESALILASRCCSQ